MKNESKNIRLTALHFCLLFVLFFTILYGIAFAANKSAGDNDFSPLAEISDIRTAITPESPLSFVLFYRQDSPADLQMERNLSNLCASEGINICCYKVNGMACEDICMEHSISGFPSVLILKEGIEVNRILGVTSGRNLRHIYKKVK